MLELAVLSSAMALVSLDNMALDVDGEPPFKKLKIQDQNTQEVKCLAKCDDFDSIAKHAVEVEDDQHGSTDQKRTVDLLGKLYPTWVGVLQALENQSQFVDAMVLLSYIDCGWPKLFLTQDDMFRVKWKTKSQGKKTSTDNMPVPREAEQFTEDGSSIKNKAPEGTVSGNSSPDGSYFQKQPPDGLVSDNHSPGSNSYPEVAPEDTVSGNYPPYCSSPEDPPPEGLPVDGIPTQLRVDLARLKLSGDYGDVALILNGFYGWCRAGPREQGAWCDRDEEGREEWCEEYCINTSEMRVLWKAFQDLLKLIERETNVDLSWVQPVAMKEITTSTEDKMKEWTSLIIRKCPELLYAHSGVPGQEYMNLSTGNVEPLYLSRNFNFDTSVKPHEYVISFPCNANVSASTFPQRKYDNLLTIKCIQLHPEDLAVRRGEKAVKVAVIGDVGVAVIRKLTEKQQTRITDMEHDISVQCGVLSVLVHVQVDLLRNQLHVYAPKHCSPKAHEVVRHHVDLAKAQVESQTVEVFPFRRLVTGTGPGRSVCLGAGGLLHGVRYQGETAERTALIHVTTTPQNRAALYENFDEDVMRRMLAVHGISEETVTALRRNKTFPAATLWGSAVFKDHIAMKKSVLNFNCFEKEGGVFRMESVKNKKHEIFQRFEVKRDVVTQVHVYFFNDVAFEKAKEFPWQDYWVIDKINFYRSTREANLVFKMPRDDLKKLKEDMYHLCGSLTTNIVNLNHKRIRPDDWSEDTIHKVMMKVKGECLKNAGPTLMKTIDLRQSTVNKGDKTLQGYVRWESSVPKTETRPPRLETRLGMSDGYDEDMFTLNLTRAGEIHNVLLCREAYKVLRDYLNMFTASILDVVHEPSGGDGDGGVSVLVILGSIDEQEVLNLMEPEVIYGVDTRLGAMHEAGYYPFLYLCKEQPVAVEVVPQRRQINVYGIEQERVKAAQLIRGILTLAEPGSGADPGLMRSFESLPLRGPEVPGNLLMEMFIKWGTRLEKLNELPGCYEVTLDSNMENLQCVGSPVAIQKIKMALDKLCFSLTGSDVTLYGIQETCCACLSTICDVTNRSYALELCGHVYCTDCLITQVKTSVNQKTPPSLPITCASRACGALMSAQDILAGCTMGDVPIHDLLHVVYLHHITMNRDYVRHCTTDGCPVVYEVPVEGEEHKFNCPSCKQSTCINCNTPWHPGLSCVVKALIETLEDERLREWIMEDAENRKMCPECRVGIEKNGGCANVQCAGCTRSICWRCMETFKTSAECYAHISKHT